eukprot:scaffold12232_cov57-Cylindrotheca_fusiformis.AAC.1
MVRPILASDSPARSSRNTMPTYRRGERYEGRRSSNTYRGQSRDNRNYRPSLTSRVHHIAIESDSEEEIVFDDTQDDGAAQEANTNNASIYSINVPATTEGAGLYYAY